MMQQCVLPGVDVQIERKLRQNLRLKVIPRTGLARSTICRLIAQRQFASPVWLAGRAVGWRATDLDRWNAGRPTSAHWSTHRHDRAIGLW